MRPMDELKQDYVLRLDATVGSKDWRRQLERFFRMNLSRPQAERCTLASYEVITNLVRHTAHVPGLLQIKIISDEKDTTIVIEDNGSAFENFPSIWRHAVQGTITSLDNSFGLMIIYQLFPQADYHPKKTQYMLNQFVLPLATSLDQVLPDYFSQAAFERTPLGKRA